MSVAANEPKDQAEFNRIMDAAAAGMEAAAKAYVANDVATMRARLDDVEDGVRLLRLWAADSDDNVVSLHPPEVGDGAVLEPDDILDGAKGAFLQVVVLGFDKDGEFEVRSSHGSRDAMWIIQRGSLHLLAETE